MAGGPVASTRTSASRMSVGPRVGGRGRCSARVSRALRAMGSPRSAATAATRRAERGVAGDIGVGAEDDRRPGRPPCAALASATPGSTATGVGAGGLARRRRGVAAPRRSASLPRAWATGAAPPDVVGHPGDGPARLGDGGHEGVGVGVVEGGGHLVLLLEQEAVAWRGRWSGAARRAPR